MAISVKLCGGTKLTQTHIDLFENNLPNLENLTLSYCYGV
jgi:hypothetical protein